MPSVRSHGFATIFFPMKRFLASLSILTLAGACWLGPTARASDVHFGVSLAIPFEHGAVGITFGHAPYPYPRPYYGHGPYHGHGHHGHHGYAYAPHCGAYGPWLPSSYVGVAINPAVVIPAPVVVAPQPALIEEEPAALSPPRPVAPPEPAVFLPKSTDMAWALQLRLKGTTYFYVSGRFFKRTSTGYVSTAAPIGAIAQHLPGDAEAMMLGAQEYFESGPAVFKLVGKGFMLIDG